MDDSRHDEDGSDVDAKRQLWLDALVLILTLLFGWYYRNSIVDDGFIFARYAHNILSGNGWCFNASEIVNGCTSVLWLLVVTGLMTILGGASALVAANAIAVALLGLGMSRLLGRRPPWLRFWIVVAVVSNKVVWRSVGLDATLTMALCTWACVLYARNRKPLLVGIVLGLSILGRPDAVLLAALLWSYDWVRSKRPSILMVLGAAVVVVPWLITSYIVFGSVLPMTFKAKTAQSQLGWWSAEGPFALAAMHFISKSWILLALGIYGVVAHWRRKGSVLLPEYVLLAYGIVHALAYTAIRAPAGYPWYYLPLDLALLLGAFLGVGEIANSVQRVLTSRRRLDPATSWLRVLLSVLIVALPLELTRETIVYAARHPTYRYATAYKAAADRVRRQGDRGATIAATEIGYVGYYAQSRIIDIHALIHPDAIREIVAGRNWWWLDKNPDFVLIHEPPWFGEPGHAEFAAEADRRFRAAYERLESFEADRHGPRSDGLELWARRHASASVP